MKKLTALLLAALLLLSLGAAASAEEMPSAGAYTLTGMTDENGKSLEEEIAALTEMGEQAVLTVAEDGSAVLDLFGETAELRFDPAAGVVLIDEEPSPYTVSESTLLLYDPNSGLSLRFAPPKPGAEEPEAPEAFVPVVDGDAIPGLYELIALTDREGNDLSEQLALLRSLGLRATLTVQDDGSAVRDLFGDTSELTLDFAAMTMTENGETQAFTWDAGLLTLPSPEGGSMVFGRTGRLHGAAESASDSGYTLRDELLLDNEYCRAVLNEVRETEAGLGFSLYLENRSDKNFRFTWEAVTVNGEAFDCAWSQDVRAGKKAKSVVLFDREELGALGVGQVNELRFTLRADDRDDPGAESLVQLPCAVYPSRRPMPEGKSLLDNGLAAFVLLGEEEESDNYSLRVWLENRTDAPLVFSWEDVSVDDYMLDPGWRCTLPAHGTEYSQVSFSREALADCGIETPESVEFTLVLYAGDSGEQLCSEFFVCDTLR